MALHREAATACGKSACLRTPKRAKHSAKHEKPRFCSCSAMIAKLGSRRRRRNRRAGKERQQQRQEQTRQARAAEGRRQAEAKFVQQQELQWLSKGGMGSTERRIRRKQRRVREWARGTTIWRLRPKGQAGEHEGSAPAKCRRQVRAAGARWGRRPRYWRLGGGGKTGWVT